MAKTAAVLVNLTDGQILLPKLYESQADKEADKDGKEKLLGAKCDHGVAGRPQPLLELSVFELQQLRNNKIIKNMMAPINPRPQLDIRAPSFDLSMAS
jgi:hypothetical protein